MIRMVKCQGSHLRCQGCACPCHSKLDDEQPTSAKPRPAKKPKAKPPAPPVKKAKPKPVGGRPTKRVSQAALYMRRYRASETGGRRLLKDFPADEIKAKYRAGTTISQLSRDYDATWKTIKRVLGDEPLRPYKPKGNLLALDADAIKAEHAAGKSIVQLAKDYGVDRRTIYRRLGYPK